MSNPEYNTTIKFQVNGEEVTVQNPDPQLVLVDFLRENLHLTGPKKPCGEGGCGGCTVVLQCPTEGTSFFPDFVGINSCLRRVVQCEGLSFFTAEFFASEYEKNASFRNLKGENIPKAIAYHNGSQCGYCTSGFVCNTAAYCASTPKENRTIIDIENLYDGNLCRCTGFRPILYGAKTLAANSDSTEAKQTPSLVVNDYSNYYNGGLSHDNVHVFRPLLGAKMMSMGSAPMALDSEPEAPQYTVVKSTSGIWVSGATSIEALFKAVDEVVPPQSQNFVNVKFVGANTSAGIFKRNEGYNPYYLFDLTTLTDTKDLDLSADILKIGGGCTITQLINAMNSGLQLVAGAPGAPRIIAMNNHLQRVASTILRNISSIAGNLCMIRNFGFASDLGMVMYGLNASLEIVVKGSNDVQTVSIQSFLTDSSLFVNQLFIIKNIIIPLGDLATPKTLTAGCFKVAKRLELSHALVNTACCIVDDGSNLQSNIAFTFALNISASNFFNPSMILPVLVFSKTIQWISDHQQLYYSNQYAKFINGLKAQFLAERNELIPSSFSQPLSDQEFQKGVCFDFFKKVILELKQNLGIGSVKPIDYADIFYQRRTTPSKGQQKFNVYAEEASEPLVKLEALMQSQGKALYTWNNVNLAQQCLNANFLLSRNGFVEFKINLDAFSQYLPNIRVLTAEKIEAEFNYSKKAKPYMSSSAGPDPFSKNYLVQFPSDGMTQQLEGGCWIAKRYTMYSGQPVALLLSENEQELANALVFAQNNYSLFVQEIGACSLLRKDPNNNGGGGDDDSGVFITNKPIVDLDQSIELGLELSVTIPLVQSCCTPNLDFQNPQIPWDQFNNDQYIQVQGKGKTGHQMHFYMEPQAAIATPLDYGGVEVLSATQSPLEVQQNIAGMFGLPQSKIIVKVLRLGGGFGGKTVQSTNIALAAAISARIFNRQVRVALDRNTDATIFGGRHPWQGSYKLAADKSTLKISAISLAYQSDAGYSQDCTNVVSNVGVVNSFNCYNYEYFDAAVKAYYTNKITSTAFRSFGVVQSQFLTELSMEHLVENVVNETNPIPSRFSSEKSYLKYLEDWYRLRFDIRKINFFKDGDSVPYSTTPLDYVNMSSVWDEVRNIYLERVAQAVKFNQSAKTKKYGVGIMPMMYSISYNTVFFMQGEATLSVKSDGSIIMIVGGVDMGQGLNTKMVQVAAQTLCIPFSLITVSELTSNTPPNPSSTGASTGTDLNGAAVQAAATEFKEMLNEYYLGWWNSRKQNPEFIPYSFTTIECGDRLFAELMTLCTDEFGAFKYPVLWVTKDQIQQHFSNNGDGDSDVIISGGDNDGDAAVDDDNSTKISKIKNVAASLISDEKVEWMKFKTDQYKAIWAATISQAYSDRKRLLFSGHANIENVTGIDTTTGRGSPDMFQNYAAAVSMVEVDMLTGEINFKSANIVYDAGRSLNPAIDIGQIEGAFIQGCGYLSSEQVLFNETGLITSNGTWEYKPPFAKSIPEEFVVHLFPTYHLGKNERERYRMREELRKTKLGGGILSSKSTGEPPLVISNSFFLAIRDALRNYRDGRSYKKYQKCNKVSPHSSDSFGFTTAPATVSTIWEYAEHIRKTTKVNNI